MEQTLHGTAVAVDGTGVLLIGPSGAGKSALALQVIAQGGLLIADDQVMLTASEGHVVASCPPNIDGLIEARGVGVLNAPMAGPTRLHMVVDMGQIETERVPPLRDVTLVGHLLPLLWRVDSPHFNILLTHLLRHGRSTR